MMQLLSEDSWIFISTRSFWLWNCSVAAYVALMIIAGGQSFWLTDLRIPISRVRPTTAECRIHPSRAVLVMATVQAVHHLKYRRSENIGALLSRS
jgi:hypothetical protein